MNNVSPKDVRGVRQIRERDWCNVVTGHEGDSAAYLWRLQNFTLGEAVLQPSTKAERGPVISPSGPVTAVALSECGNFGVVGTAAGRVDRYNVQSGLHRGYFIRCGPWERHVALATRVRVKITASFPFGRYKAILTAPSGNCLGSAAGKACPPSIGASGKSSRNWYSSRRMCQFRMFLVSLSSMGVPQRSC